MNVAAARRRVIVAFYASLNHGSEYRAGAEFIRFAAAEGFDLAVIADLEQNAQAAELSLASHGIEVVRVPSLVTRQATLYRFSDFIPQTFWHLRVARWLAAQRVPVEILWVQNGALPWLPLAPYFSLTKQVVWGPVGGGEPPPAAMMCRLRWSVRLRERLRSLMETRLLDGKSRLARKSGAPRLVCFARTVGVQERLATSLHVAVPVIPEILDPIKAVHLAKKTGTSPRFLWVGQDIPRKNLQLALDLLTRLQVGSYPQATLDVFGCKGTSGAVPHGVRFHGWVSRIDWLSYRDDGVLLLTSFREGLPSVILEATANGLLCVAADVGAISTLGVDTVYTLPRHEYPNYTDDTVQALATRIRRHLDQTAIHLPPVSHEETLKHYLRAQDVIP